MKSTRRQLITSAALSSFAIGYSSLSAQAQTSSTGDLIQSINGTLNSKLVPMPVPFTVLLPKGYESMKDLPLLIGLHGVDGIQGFAFFQGAVQAAWDAGELPPCVVAIPNSGRSFWLNWKDGSQKWESFLVEEFIPQLKSTYKISKLNKKVALIGHSMGGLGSLRLAFKYPDQFGGVAALESAIEPTLIYSETNIRNTFFRPAALMESLFGKPVDTAYWAANNPTNIAAAQASKIQESGIQIYLDVGDRDILNTFDGVEFLHRVMWDNGIDHEYRVVRGGDHWGKTVPLRFRDGMKFLSRQVFSAQDEDASFAPTKERINQMKKATGVDPLPIHLPLPRTRP